MIYQKLYVASEYFLNQIVFLYPLMAGIRIIQDLDRVNDPVRRQLGELQATAQTIGHDNFRVNIFHLADWVFSRFSSFDVVLYF